MEDAAVHHLNEEMHKSGSRAARVHTAEAAGHTYADVCEAGLAKQKGRRADALALRADERRDKLRKAAGRSTCPSIRRSLNGETRAGKTRASARESIARGGEPGELKHLSSRRKRKKHRFRE